ncbi:MULTISPECIES: metal-dependent transcriptional regulator [Desulfococcus]|jgi:DtxR family Mn-dependent transcriptional regulator|uniref:Transcriptional regulator MntR n=1 Tax=Desulfococcus multivorans DSM 2059 TaxID=1121405 RepID=S7TRX7_DESML|nr:metal-dependent transcriptional regulator [Desulfococcus multivorans]AOY57152.1 iron-dependent repressor, DtxR family [Desulfococcus multivorans]AQU99643.1 DtxR family iron (metal) dependent repressor [Desulfococcus multivorans]EPR39907.1 iron (metal) dependent repressor, DtxR family [Desulfococcus multivorans DSM 2059]MDX9819622.1 metal-dependent transcriptional regulator [Desulfococcus multivorans]SKA22979.1 iron (metal) dependent repressor, DtxR family [Desulfococcus multivorans DSM 2059
MTTHDKGKAGNKPLTPVMEDYLEAIFDLDKEKRVVRVKDIAKRMDVKMPTVSSMLKTLNERGLVAYEKYEHVELTEDGADVGREMRRRHRVLNQFLTEILRIDPKVADQEACKMEHALSADTLDSLIDFMEFIQSCPRTGEKWIEFFEEFRRHGRRPEKCQARCDVFSVGLKKQLEVT